MNSSMRRQFNNSHKIYLLKFYIQSEHFIFLYLYLYLCLYSIQSVWLESCLAAIVSNLLLLWFLLLLLLGAHLLMLLLLLMHYIDSCSQLSEFVALRICIHNSTDAKAIQNKKQTEQNVALAKWHIFEFWISYKLHGKYTTQQNCGHQLINLKGIQINMKHLTCKFQKNLRITLR